MPSFCYQNPVDLYSKKQASVEMATYGSEFVAAKTATEQIMDTRQTDTIYIKTQVFRLLRYYSPAPRNIARSDWATQNITHNMTPSIT